MDYKKRLDSIISETSYDKVARNKELFDYCRKQFESFDPETGATRDMVTQLPGLRVFFYEAGEIIQSNPDKRFAVITMDISQFKAVNEFCGRKAGDEILRFISGVFSLYETNRACTKAGHARADIFLLCTYYEKEDELVDIVTDMYNAITSYPFPYKVSPSFGICSDPDPLPSPSFLKDCATIAMNGIKGKFYTFYAVFDEKMRRQMLQEKQVENDIINALNRNDLQLFIQPKVDMNTGKVYAGESLIRWLHPELGMITPGAFVPVLEKNGFIIQVDFYIWEKVFSYLHKLKEEGRELVPISINISRVHVHDEDMCKKLLFLCEKYGIDPKYIPLEITESAFESDEHNMYDSMRYLQEKGFRISMDDFGTGYSSLQMLASTPLDEIKIDRSFIIDIQNEKSRIVLNSIIGMLKGIGVDYIVEGVEEENQRDLLLEYGCNKAQGFLFYKPMPVEDFDKILREQE